MLVLPGSPAFTYVQDNLDVGSPGTTPGTSFTCGASSADGTAVEIMELIRDCHYLVVGFSASAASTADNSALLDIMSDPTGGTTYTTSVIQDLAGWPGVAFSGVASGNWWWYHFPLWIKSGTALAVRGRRNAAATLAYKCIMFAYCAPKRPEMWWCGQGVETLGADAANSRGTFVTPGNAAWGTYTTIGTSTRRYGAIQMGVNGSDATTNTAQYLFQLGAGSQRLGTGTQYIAASTSELSVRLGLWHPEFVDVPDGTAVQGRAYCSTTPEDYQMLAYGVY